MDRTKVVLVDKEDNVLGEMEKMKAHQQGVLHRAFSVFIFNSNHELLLQQRAGDKYHGAGLWTNTCCSHPQLGEQVGSSAAERLNFEMGMDCALHFSHAFIYKMNVENSLIEHELDHVFFGYSNGDPQINTSEVQDFKWMRIEDLLADIERNPAIYTYWFKVALPLVLKDIKKAS